VHLYSEKGIAVLREYSTCFVLVVVCGGLIQKALAQDTSTPEERAQWVVITRQLESSPLDDAVNKQGEASLKRLSLALTPCARATRATDAPSVNASPTIRCFSSSDRYCRFLVTACV